RIVAPHLALRAVVEERELPRMHADDTGDPTGRRRRARDLESRVDEIDECYFTATPTSRLERTHEAVLEKEFPRVVAQPPQLGVLGRRCGERRRELFRAFDKIHVTPSCSCSDRYSKLVVQSRSTGMRNGASGQTQTGERRRVARTDLGGRRRS